MSSKTLSTVFIAFNAFLLINVALSAPNGDDKATELRNIMKGGKTEVTDVDIGQAKAIIEGTNSRRRRSVGEAGDNDLTGFVDFFNQLTSKSGSDNVRYGLEKTIKPMKCVLKKFNNVKFLGQLTGVAENVDSEDICGGICYQFNFEGGQCKSANYLKNSKKCELMADIFDANGPMSKFITYYVEISRNSLYTIPVSCKEEGGQPVTPPPVQTNGSFNGNISLKNSCGKTLFPNRVSKSSANNPSTRIVGGTEARPHSMPWIISIHENGSPFCGGSVIRCSEKDESRLILTAAHCIQQPGRWSELKAEDLTVGLGEHSLVNKDQGEQRIRVSKFEINKNYNDETSANDIAVVQLSQPVKFSQTIQPACLPDATDPLPPAGTPCVVAGWGTTSEGGRQSDKLMQVISPIISDNDCTSPSYYGSEVQPDKMFCAGYKEGQKDSCQGDSGGPYVCYNGDTATQFGVVSFGIGCARAAKPGVYARVPNYRGWIDEMRQKYCV